MKAFNDSSKNRPGAIPMERHIVQGENALERHEFLFNPKRVEVDGEIYEMTAVTRSIKDSGSITKMLREMDISEEWSYATQSQLASFADQYPEMLSKSRLLALGEITPRSSSPIKTVSLHDGEIFNGAVPGFSFNSDWDFLIVRKIA